MTEWIVSAAPVPYPEAVDFMDKRVAAIREGTAPECVWLLEHPPLYTAGTSAQAADLLDPRFPVYPAGRGGQYTYHGPGQRIAYVMLDLKVRQNALDIRRYVCGLENLVIESLQEFGIAGERRDGRIGVWVRTAQGDAKIAAIGVRVRRGVTMHGVSINVSPDLSHYKGIIPCGISDAGVTSLKDLGCDVPMAALDAALRGRFDKIFCP